MLSILADMPELKNFFDRSKGMAGIFKRNMDFLATKGKTRSFSQAGGGGRERAPIEPPGLEVAQSVLEPAVASSFGMAGGGGRVVQPMSISNMIRRSTALPNKRTTLGQLPGFKGRR